MQQADELYKTESFPLFENTTLASTPKYASKQKTIEVKKTLFSFLSSISGNVEINHQSMSTQDEWSFRPESNVSASIFFQSSQQ